MRCLCLVHHAKQEGEDAFPPFASIQSLVRILASAPESQDCAVDVSRWAEGVVVVVGKLGHRVLELADPFVCVVVVVVILPSRLSCFRMLSANPLLLLLLLLFWREDLFKRGYTALYSGLGLGEELSSRSKLPWIGIEDRGLGAILAFGLIAHNSLCRSVVWKLKYSVIRYKCTAQLPIERKFDFDQNQYQLKPIQRD